MTARPSFAAMPTVEFDALGTPTAVVFGADEATPYVAGEPSHSAGGAAAIRAASMRFARQLGQLDFDLGRTMLPTKDDWRGLADAGDVATNANDAAGNRERIETATRQVLAAGAVPIVLGGDDSVPIPVLAGYADHGPVTVVQVDAHVDWGDRIQGETMGYGSPMRRAAELPWVTGMTQVGIRGLGSGVASQIDDAQGWGSRIVTAYDLYRGGIDAALNAVAPGGRYVVSIDCDGIDPAIFPAVAMPTPGGLRYEEMILLLHGLAKRGTIAGVVLAEYVPDRDDAQRTSALIAARIAAVAMGLILGPADGA